MPDIMLLGIEEQVLTLEIDDNPADNFPCMPSDGINSEMRALLYAQLMGIFFDEAQSLEQLVLEYGSEGPWVFKLDFTITERLSEVEEDDIDTIALNWSQTGEMSSLNIEANDLLDILARFLFNLIHFCMLVKQEKALSVFIYSE